MLASGNALLSDSTQKKCRYSKSFPTILPLKHKKSPIFITKKLYYALFWCFPRKMPLTSRYSADFTIRCAWNSIFGAYFSWLEVAGKASKHRHGGKQKETLFFCNREYSRLRHYEEEGWIWECKSVTYDWSLHIRQVEAGWGVSWALQVYTDKCAVWIHLKGLNTHCFDSFCCYWCFFVFHSSNSPCILDIYPYCIRTFVCFLDEIRLDEMLM